ncbi:carboxymuconolactone decarboxylase family protein [Mycobacterium sp. ACS4331]|uniref:carboxymuconolactone decarboxylase family protein n=1 Tax=Mycobacterium sp. ACS4331 TaxID=1834121 RepID=UPI000802085D|nr:carboxymuconolactone decarboxylase family protein [Mycobacterium sp. ACS4331]OBF18463.1 carboxymuconolactone decarboxylase [Mycobacterium sp. ACS4331]
MDTQRTEHIHIDKQSPAAYKALVAVANTVSTVAKEAGVARGLVELVNIRVSQLNGCASCLEIHHRRASAAGVSDKQLATVPAWRDTELFDERERAALRLAEITTTLPDRDTADREYARAAEALNPDELSAIVWVATTINAFNRVSVLSGHIVRPDG